MVRISDLPDGVLEQVLHEAVQGSAVERSRQRLVDCCLKCSKAAPVPLAARHLELSHPDPAPRAEGCWAMFVASDAA